MNVRTRLILSYALIIALCLGLAALVSTVLLRRYQHELTSQRLADIAEPVALILHENIDPATFDAAALLVKEADQTQTRMVLVGANLRDLPAARTGRPLEGRTLQDTDDKIAPGTALSLPAEVYLSWQDQQRRRPATPATGATPMVPRVNAQLSLPEPSLHSFPLDGGQPVDLAAIPLRAAKGTAGFRVLIVVEPAGAVVQPFARLVLPLGWAAASALLVSILVALALARSIARPLVALTAATEALAGGDYSRRVPVRGRDEVGQLGRSFNAMAGEIERTRGRERDFLTNVSHDLKTPLTSIQGFAGALVDGTCPPDRYPAVARIIHQEAQRMGLLVGKILQLSRLEAGELPLSPTPVDLTEILHANAQRFAPAAAAAGVELRVEVAADSPITFWADRARLEQALSNLLDNALRHTPSGGRIDLIGAPLHDRRTPAVQIIVRDTGSGIAAADLPRVFERFYQADKARAAGRGGSGLGLAIVKELVERHDGTVRADGVVGGGTAITMVLPLRRPMGRGPGSGGAVEALPVSTPGDGAVPTAQQAAGRGGGAGGGHNPSS